jgi:hypothetical protein
LKLGWITVPHPLYSPDLAPTDYHLFRSLSNHLREKKFDDENDVKMELVNFFDQKSQDFYERGILSLSERWQQVIDSSGDNLQEIIIAYLLIDYLELFKHQKNDELFLFLCINVFLKLEIYVLVDSSCYFFLKSIN